MRTHSWLALATVASLGACGWQVRQTPTMAAAPAAHAATGVRLAANDDNAGNPDQVICKRQEITGSRLEGAKECHTRAEWAQLKATGMDKLQLFGAPGPTPTQTAAQAGNGP